MADVGVDAEPLAWLQGVWRRDGRALGPEPMVEVSRVVWVQVGTWFADVRDPCDDVGALASLDEAQAFSGVVRPRAGTVVWQHDLDTKKRTPCHVDWAVVTQEGAELIERGPGYEERWRREEQGGPVTVMERRAADGTLTARLVGVGEILVSVWAGQRPGGAAMRFTGDRWEVEMRVGAGAIPWSAALATRSGQAPSGWERVV